MCNAESRKNVDGKVCLWLAELPYSAYTRSIEVINHPLPILRPTDQAFALASEVETLKHQLQELHNFVHRGAAASGSQSFQGQSPLPTSHPTPSEQSSADHLRHSDSLNTASPLPGDTALLSATDVDKRLESSVSVLENLVEDGDATTRPTFYLRTSRTRPSRIPPPLDQATRVDLLLDYIYDILPERAIATRLTQEYFQGSMQYGWHVRLTPRFLIIAFTDDL